MASLQLTATVWGSAQKKTWGSYTKVTDTHHVAAMVVECQHADTLTTVSENEFLKKKKWGITVRTGKAEESKGEWLCGGAQAQNWKKAASPSRKQGWLLLLQLRSFPSQKEPVCHSLGDSPSNLESPREPIKTQVPRHPSETRSAGLSWYYNPGNCDRLCKHLSIHTEHPHTAPSRLNAASSPSNQDGHIYNGVYPGNPPRKGVPGWDWRVPS